MTTAKIKDWGEYPIQLINIINHAKTGFVIDCKPLVILRSIENAGTVTIRKVQIPNATSIVPMLA